LAYTTKTDPSIYVLSGDLTVGETIDPGRLQQIRERAEHSFGNVADWHDVRYLLLHIATQDEALRRLQHALEFIRDNSGDPVMERVAEAALTRSTDSTEAGP
jgi:hypothetical protein